MYPDFLSNREKRGAAQIQLSFFRWKRAAGTEEVSGLEIVRPYTEMAVRPSSVSGSNSAVTQNAIYLGEDSLGRTGLGKYAVESGSGDRARFRFYSQRC